MAIVLDNNNFKDTIAKGVSLVDFWAEWCGPCQQMLPILEEFSKDMEGKVNVGKVNVDENPDIATEYFIRSIPTLLIFKDGKQVGDPLIGVQKKEDLIEKCSQYL